VAACGPPSPKLPSRAQAHNRLRARTGEGGPQAATAWRAKPATASLAVRGLQAAITAAARCCPLVVVQSIYCTITR
jgi:hypothetical protein